MTIFYLLHVINDYILAPNQSSNGVTVMNGIKHFPEYDAPNNEEKIEMKNALEQAASGLLLCAWN